MEWKDKQHNPYYSTARWQALRRMALAMEPLCAECGKPATDVHHIVALDKGGSNEFRNLQSLCRSCHSSKTARGE